MLYLQKSRVCQVGVPLKNQFGRTSCVLFHLSRVCRDHHVWQKSANTWLKTRNKNPNITTCHTLRSCLSAKDTMGPTECRVNFFSFNVLTNVPFDLWQVETVRSDLRDTFNLFFLFSVLSECVAPHESEDTIPHNKGGKAAFSVALPHRASVYFAFVTLCCAEASVLTLSFLV